MEDKTHAKLSSSKIISATCLLTSEPAMPSKEMKEGKRELRFDLAAQCQNAISASPPIAMPMSAFFSAGESFTPSPVTCKMSKGIHFWRSQPSTRTATIWPVLWNEKTKGKNEMMRSGGMGPSRELSGTAVVGWLAPLLCPIILWMVPGVWQKFNSKQFRSGIVSTSPGMPAQFAVFVEARCAQIRSPCGC